MSGLARKAILSTTLLFLVLAVLKPASSFSTGTSLSITIKNETGYILEEVEYVRETGDLKTLVEQAQNLPNGGSCNFRLEGEGAYRIYASLTMGGKKVYAKGNAYNLHGGRSY
jgi:hypothetical protein